jgi:hypothetical protein
MRRIVLFAAALLSARLALAAAPSANFFLLDLRGNGFQTSGTNKASGTRWTTPQTDDAFLAVDATGLRAMGIEVTTRDRLRLDGTTLVSTSLRVVADGQSRDIERTWQMLVALDTNRDGKLDNHDTTWVHLRLFVDADGDGRIAAAEVHGVADGSIASMATKPGRDPRTDGFGNVLTESWLVTTDGRTRNTADVRFGALPAEERMATR